MAEKKKKKRKRKKGEEEAGKAKRRKRRRRKRRSGEGEKKKKKNKKKKEKTQRVRGDAEGYLIDDGDGDVFGALLIGDDEGGAGGELVGDMGELEASWTATVSSISPKK